MLFELCLIVFWGLLYLGFLGLLFAGFVVLGMFVGFDFDGLVAFYLLYG